MLAVSLLAVAREAQIMIWSGALILVVLVMGGVIALLRRRYLDEPDADDGPVMPLSELRRLRDEGVLSDVEYERAAEQMRREIHGDTASSDPDATRRQGASTAPAREISEEIVAPPGYDLTGEPLPDPNDER